MNERPARPGPAGTTLPVRGGTYYGWRIAWTLAITTTVSYGVLYYAFSVFVTPIETEFGWTRAQTSGAFSVALLLSGVTAPLVGRWVDRRGGRALMTLGSLGAAALLYALAHVSSLTAYTLIWAGLGLAMSAVLYEPAFAVLAAWFRQGRARATLLVTLVAGLASTIFIPLVTWLVGALGWRGALEVLALVVLLLTAVPHALVLRRSPRDLGLRPDGTASSGPAHPGQPEGSGVREALRDRSFWQLTAAFSLARFTTVAVGAHLVPMLLARGHDLTFVALAGGAVGLMALPGRLLMAPLAARAAQPVVAAWLFAAQAVSAALLLALPGVPGTVAFVVLFGASNGAITLSRAALVAGAFGTRNFGSINGNVALVVAVVQAAAPFAAGAAYTLSGGYTAVLAVLAVVSFAAVPAALGVRVRTAEA